MRTRLIKHVAMLIVLGAVVSGTLLLVYEGLVRRVREPEPEGNIKSASGEPDLPCFMVQLGKFTITVAAGLVEPVRAEYVMCPLEGRSVILSILPEGTLVKKGQLVCELGSSSFGDRLDGPGIAGTKEEEAARSRRQGERRKLYAPADGTLQWGGSGPVDGNRPRIEPGATVFWRWCIFGLYDPTGTIRVRAEVHETVVDQIWKGMPARIRLDAFPGELLTGTVREIAPLPNGGGYVKSEPRYYDTLVSIDGGSPRPRPGMRARVEILVHDLDNVLSVPLEAVLHFDGKDHAAVKRPDGDFDWCEITLGAHSESLAEVKRGLQNGECVCLQPAVLRLAQETARASGIALRRFPDDPEGGNGKERRRLDRDLKRATRGQYESHR